MKKWPLYVFSGLVLLSLLTPFWVFSPLQFPYVTSKAFYFRIVMELALPFYLGLIYQYPKLRPKLRNPLNIAVLAFLLIAIIASFSGVNVSRSLWGNFERMGGAYYLAHLVGLYFYVQLLGQAGGVYLKRFLQAFIVVALAVTVNGLSGWLGGPTLTQDPSLPARVSSTFGNPIFFASFLIIPMFLSAYFALSEENRGLKIFYGVAALLQLLGIFSSGTRGAAVGVIASVFIGAALYIVLTKRVRRYGLIALALFVIVAGILYVNHSKLAPGSTLSRLVNLKDSNTEARLIQWKIALRGYKDFPLLGVGPENYYLISDTYYNPAMYQYDASWFDKPHNYILEILVTTGALGLAAYLTAVVLCFYALWRAQKEGLLGLAEMCLLVAAMVAYQVQNFTVFDTVSASVAFFAFLGLSAYLWVESSAPEPATKHHEKTSALSGGASAVLALSGVVMLYIVYISNIQSLEAAKRTNFGYAYTNYNPQASAAYFTSALNVNFNLDPRETANRYSDFANAILNSDLETKDPKFVADQLDKATANQRAITEKTKNDPLLWMRLSIDEIDEAIIHSTSTALAQETINKTIALAPKRVELLQLQLQMDGYYKDWPGAVSVAEKSVQLNPYSAELKWQLAQAYYLNKQTEQAVAIGDQAIAQGFTFNSLQQFAWYIQYYENKKDYPKVAPLLEQAIALQPGEVSLYIDLAHVYASLGNINRATELAQQVEQLDPAKKAEMEAFISSLKK